MKNPPAELSLIDSTKVAAEAHLRFQQMYQGVPVWSAHMWFHSRHGQITAVNGHYQPDLDLDPTPLITASAAEATVRAELAAAQAVLQEEVKLVVMTYHTEPTLTWLVRLDSEDPLGQWYYFINARTGEVTYDYNGLPHAKNRRIHDTGGACSTVSLPGILVATEGTGSSLPPGAARNAFDNMGNTYDYFNTVFGRDSYDDLGGAIIASVNFGTPGVCTSAAINAFWNGTQFAFGSGGVIPTGPVNNFSGAEDVVAHEFTHAVTQYTADLIYQFEQGALNESISDIFGVFAQQRSTGNFNDWKIGEGLGNSQLFRDMSDPTLHSQPAHLSNYVELGFLTDNGGVHINSGIPNKAAYLMVVGGASGGVTVTGLGLAKTEQIFYRALLLYLSPLSGFADTRDSTIQGCQDLAGSFGISAADCNQVQNAWAAVGVGNPFAVPPPPLANVIYLPTIFKSGVGANIYEPNDDVSQAFGPLTSGALYQAYLQTNGDVDIYHFTTNGGSILISLSSLPAGTNYDLELYNAFSSKPISVSFNGGSTPELISLSVPAGTHYIFISPTTTASSVFDPYDLVVFYP